ncbi:MAG: hypothetical protein JWO17_1796 [Actinomycetia bacterium]|nr:hypothetical protein [Actinomycetes bacterium]
MRVLVAGMLAGDPGQGGATWAVLQYALGLRRLGHDVWFVEPVDALTRERAAYFGAVTRAFGLAGRAALLIDGTQETVGVPYRALRSASGSADLLLNLSGILRDESLLEAIPVRVYVDLDPAFNQLWHEVEGIDRGFDGHTRHVTVGLELGRADCPVPTAGLEWIPTLPPVVLAHWPVGTTVHHDGFTTVGNWRGYGSIAYDGHHYGQRAHSFRELLELPVRCEERFLPALAIDTGEERDLAALDEHRWNLLDPASVAGDPGTYRRFLRGSKAELGVAKSGYVLSRCGWFSDRSACYLAAGRPVVAQDTGWSRRLPTGEGLFAYSTVDDALGAIETIRADYRRHGRRARELAEELFDSDRVLTRLLEAVA